MRRRHELGSASVVLALAVVFLSGCREPFGFERDEAAPLQTRALEYRLERQGLSTTVGGATGVISTQLVLLRMTFTYTNQTSETVYAGLCPDELARVRLQRLDNGFWIDADSGPANCGGLIQVQRIDPGESWQGKVRIFGGLPECGCIPQFANSTPEGVFRLVWRDVRDGIGNRDLAGNQIPEAERTSNAFRVKRPD